MEKMRNDFMNHGISDEMMASVTGGADGERYVQDSCNGTWHRVVTQSTPACERYMCKRCSGTRGQHASFCNKSAAERDTCGSCPAICDSGKPGEFVCGYVSNP